MAAKWPFDDYSWWSYSLYSASSLVMSTGEPVCALRTLLLRDPALLKGYYENVTQVLRQGSLPKSDAEALLQAARGLLKWRIAPSSECEKRKTEAIDGFLLRNRNAALAKPIPEPYAGFMERCLAAWLPEPSGIQVTGNFGPGAVAERLHHPQRYRRLWAWERYGGRGWPFVPIGHNFGNAEVCRLCAVPKDYARDRLITVEPCYSSFVQQYVRSLMLESVHSGPLRGTCMDLAGTDGQAIQRRLALKASRSKKLATVDLKDASDNISWNHVQQVFPGWVHHLLGNVRSTAFTVDGKDAHPLHIYAGMGNATTFIVETLFFAAYVKAFAWAHDLPRFVSVFGDDVICSSEVAAALIAETLPGLTVNANKTFLGADALREACGIFAYNGEDITPIRFDGYRPTWEGRVAVADVFKRLQGGRSMLHLLLAENIAAERALPNWPLSIDGYPSMSTTLVPYDAEPPSRIHHDLQVYEYKVPVREPRYRGLPTDAGWDNPYPAEVWLKAWFTGKLCTTCSRQHGSIVKFPTGSFSMRKRWLVARRCGWPSMLV